MDKRALLFVFALTLTFFLMNQWFNPPRESAQTPAPIIETVARTPQVDKEYPQEKFYVLENDYQQFVFSNIGGALAEINLSLRSPENPSSAVRPIEFDRLMKEDSSANDHFPATPFETIRGSERISVAEGGIGGYYPLLRRGIKGPHGNTIFHVPPRHYAFNILSEDQSTETQVYKVVRLEKDLIEFELSQDQRRIVKIFSLPKDARKSPYCIDLSLRLEGDARNLWISSGIPEVELISDSFTPALKYRPLKSGKPQIDNLSLPKETVTMNGFYVDWVSNSNGFLGIILDPLTETNPGLRSSKIDGAEDPTRLSLIDAQYHLYPADKYPGYMASLPLSNKPTKFRIYAGPFQQEILTRLDKTYTDPVTGYSPNYVDALSQQGWLTFISEPFAKFLFVLMKFFYQLTYSWGISIILLTVALRIMLYPLNAWSIKSTLRMQQIAPKVSAIQAKYPKDPKRAQMEVLSLYREERVNPFSGCLPLLIQLPFLIGMFDLLKSTFELRGVPFIPGWIDNLTAPDILFSWNYPIFFFGTNFHLLPLLLGAVMWFQQRVTSKQPKDPALLTDQQKQQKMMGNIMTVVFTVLFYHFPSGLNLYWLSSMLLGILQQWMMNRKMMRKRAFQSNGTVE